MGIRIGIGRTIIGQGNSLHWSSLISATIENAEPTKVVLTFDKSGNPSATDFLITDHTVSSLSKDITGRIITLVLTTPVIVFDNLYVYFKSFTRFKITNNVLDDGNTFAIYEPKTQDGSLMTNTGGTDFAYLDKTQSKLALGAEQASGVLILYGLYKITATQTNHFYTGCVVGDIFACAVVKTCDANNKVQKVLGNPLTQPSSTAGVKPIDGSFNGVNAFMRTAPITKAQPITRYIVVKQRTWTDNDFIYDGGTVAEMGLYQTGTTPNIAARAGTIGTPSDDLVVGQDGVVVVCFNGDNSFIQVNDAERIITPMGANGLSNHTLGTKGNFLSQFADIDYKAEILRSGVDSDAYILSLRNALKRKYITERSPYNIVFEGHSMMSASDYLTGQTSVYTFVKRLLYITHDMPLMKNMYMRAVGGATVQDMINRKATSVDPCFDNTQGIKNIIFIFIGCNAMIASGDGLNFYNLLKSYTESVITDGWIPVIITMPNRKFTPDGYSGYFNATVETERVVYNNAIRANTQFPYIIDCDLIPEFADAYNDLYYIAPIAHFTTASNSILAGKIVEKILSI